MASLTLWERARRVLRGLAGRPGPSRPRGSDRPDPRFSAGYRQGYIEGLQDASRVLRQLSGRKSREWSS